MRRFRLFLILASAVACSERSSSSSTGTTPVEPLPAGVTSLNDTIAITVSTANVGPTIPANFIGLSSEMSALLEPPFKRPSYVNVLKTIGSGVLRLGGGSAGGTDRTWWTPGVRDVRPDSQQVLTGADFDLLNTVCTSAGWTAIVGVNFKATLPDTFAAEAAFIQQHLGPRLTAIELGNEPDLFPNGNASYTLTTYLKNLDLYLAAFQQRAPGVPVAAPGTSYDTAWLRQTISHATNRIALATQHLYSLADDPGFPSSNIRYPTSANLLSDALIQTDVLFDKAVVAAAQPYGIPARLTELNSANLGGAPGLSGTFASALWAADHTFAAAEAGLAGVNYHTGFAGNGYSAFGINLTGTLTPRPLLYGILAFQDAAKGQILTVAPASKRKWNLSAHGSVTAADGTVRLALVNRDTASLTVRIVVPNATTVTVRRLVSGTPAAPLTDSTGVTYAGAAVTASGTFSPATSESITPVASSFLIAMPAASAAVIVVTTR